VVGPADSHAIMGRITGSDDVEIPKRSLEPAQPKGLSRSGMTDRARLSAMSPRPADGGPAERLTRRSIFGLTPLPLGVRAIWVGESERRFWSSW
jgi:hypothetical protein